MILRTPRIPNLPSCFPFKYASRGHGCAAGGSIGNLVTFWRIIGGLCYWYRKYQIIHAIHYYQNIDKHQPIYIDTFYRPWFTSNNTRAKRKTKVKYPIACRWASRVNNWQHTPAWSMKQSSVCSVPYLSLHCISCVALLSYHSVWRTSF